MRFRTQSALAFAMLLAYLPMLAATLPATTVSAAARGDKGPAGAPVTMIVFTDFQCPFSSRLFFTIRSLEEKYPQDLHVIVKQTPLDIHPDAPLAHRAALAAGQQGRFNEMAELLYANQAHIDAASILAYAAQLHLDRARFRRDLNSRTVAAAVAADMEEGRGFGITYTPTLYLNGRILTGVQTESSLQGMIDKLIAAAPAEALANQPDNGDGTPLDPKLVAELQTAPAPVQGAAGAPLTIVEFTDFQCPYCRASVAPMEQLMSQRGRQVRWIFRSFPLDFHADSQLANEAALAAGEQGRFWPMHDLLFQNQSALKLADLRTYAQKLGLNMQQFDTALQTHKFASAIAADRVLAARAGVSGTPTFVIDGKIVSGVQTFPELLQIADGHAHTPGATVSGAAVAAVTPVAAGRTVSGRVTAPLTLTWYSDVRSSLAAQQQALVQGLSRRYGDHLRILFCAFPVDAHPDSELGSAALVAAAGQGNFWQMFGLLAQRRDTLDRAKILELASSLHLDGPAFASALDAAAPMVQADRAEATRRGIQGAPVMFLNGQRVDGLQREEFYTAIFDKELAAAPVVRAKVGDR